MEGHDREGQDAEGHCLVPVGSIGLVSMSSVSIGVNGPHRTILLLPFIQNFAIGC